MDWFQSKTGQFIALATIVSTLAGFGWTGAQYVNRITTNGIAVLGAVYDSNEQIIDFDDAYYTGSSINLQMGYLMKNNWEIAGRFTQVTPESITMNNNINQYTLGFSRYVVGHNLKVQGDVSYTQEANKADVVMFRLQTEFNF